MKVTQKIYLYARPAWRAEGLEYVAFHHADMQNVDKDLTPIAEKVEFTVENVPDPIALAIGIIERQKLDALEKFQTATAELNDRLSKLQALTNEVRS